MPYNEELAARLRAAIVRQDGVTEKKMFGGIGFMVNGNMCCGVAKDDLMVRVGSEVDFIKLNLLVQFCEIDFIKLNLLVQLNIFLNSYII